MRFTQILAPAAGLIAVAHGLPGPLAGTTAEYWKTYTMDDVAIYCPSATTFVHSDMTYTASGETTLTMTNGPFTISVTQPPPVITSTYCPDDPSAASPTQAPPAPAVTNPTCSDDPPSVFVTVTPGPDDHSPVTVTAGPNDPPIVTVTAGSGDPPLSPTGPANIPSPNESGSFTFVTYTPQPTTYLSGTQVTALTPTVYLSETPVTASTSSTGTFVAMTDTPAVVPIPVATAAAEKLAPVGVLLVAGLVVVL